jgi:hypothetical protein
VREEAALEFRSTVPDKTSNPPDAVVQDCDVLGLRLLEIVSVFAAEFEIPLPPTVNVEPLIV